MLVSYTWGKALTDSVDHLSTSGAGNGVDVGVFREPQDGNQPGARIWTRGVRRHAPIRRLGRVATPLRPRTAVRRLRPGALDVFGGWEFSPIFTAQTGLGSDDEPVAGLLNIGGERRSRPNRIAAETLDSSARTVDRWFDTNAFVMLQPVAGGAGFVPNQASATPASASCADPDC